MKYITLIIIVALACLWQGCQTKCSGCDYGIDPYFFLHFHNTSDYEIDVSAHKIDPGSNKPGVFFIYPGGPIEPHSVEGREMPGGGGVGKILPYCLYNGHFSFDSIRVYFNRGKLDERYVTYHKKTFKPRDVKNPEEYRFERIDDTHVNFHYTFTNEDYNNAIKNQNATPTPIPKCPPDIKVSCKTEEGIICVW